MKVQMLTLCMPMFMLIGMLLIVRDSTAMVDFKLWIEDILFTNPYTIFKDVFVGILSWDFEHIGEEILVWRR